MFSLSSEHPLLRKVASITFCTSVYRLAKWKKSKRVWKTSVCVCVCVSLSSSLRLPCLISKHTPAALLSAFSARRVAQVCTDLVCRERRGCRRSGEASVSALFCFIWPTYSQTATCATVTDEGLMCVCVASDNGVGPQVAQILQDNKGYVCDPDNHIGGASSRGPVGPELAGCRITAREVTAVISPRRTWPTTHWLTDWLTDWGGGGLTMWGLIYFWSGRSGI